MASFDPSSSTAPYVEKIPPCDNSRSSSNKNIPISAAVESSFTPPGSPRGIPSKESSVKELYQSARESFGGELQPQEGQLVALEHPVRRGPSRMVTAQDWTVTAVGGEEEEWRPPSPQPSPPRVPSSIGKLPSYCFKEEEAVEEEVEKVARKPVALSAGTASEITMVASAPGKVILFGEHAVVYGKTAVGAAASDLRVVVTARCTSEPSLAVELPDLGVNLRRTTQQVTACFGSSLAVAPGGAEPKPAPPGPAQLDLISAFLGGEEKEEGWSTEGRKALVPLLFLALSLVPDIFLGRAGPGAQGLSLTAFSASLPVGAGLGSSAALCVATSAALTRLADTISRGDTDTDDGGGGGGSGGGGIAEKEAVVGAGVGGESLDGSAVGGKAGQVTGGGGGGRRPPPSELDRINAWAFAGETVLHGTPSGLDNTVSCYGGAIKFVKGMDGAANTTESIPGSPPLPILLTNTLVPKNTRALVAGVRRLLTAHRGPTASIFDAIGAIAVEFIERAAAGSVEGMTTAPAEGGVLGDGSNPCGAAAAAAAESPPLTAECVGELAAMNHRLLCALGVGHPALERVCEVAAAHACKSKLTGAGGGGCALTILSGKDLRKASLVNDMAAEGFECYETCLGGDGVLWHGETVPPELAAAAAEGERAEAGGSEGLSGFAARLANWKCKGVGIAAAAVIVAVAAVAPFVVVALGRRGSRRY